MRECASATWFDRAMADLSELLARAGKRKTSVDRATSRSPKAATLTGKRVSSPPQIGLTSCGRRSYTSTQTSFSRTVFALRQG